MNLSKNLLFQNYPEKKLMALLIILLHQLTAR